MADFMKILQQAQEMQGKLQKVQDELQQQTVTASAGGGMVTVEANGKQELTSIKIDPEVISKEDAQMLEDLVLAAWPGQWSQDIYVVDDLRAPAPLSAPEPIQGCGLRSRCSHG